MLYSVIGAGLVWLRSRYIENGVKELYGNYQYIRMVIILPIYKNGNKLQVENYRGITLLPSIMKIFFSILTKRVCEWAESKNIIPVEQFGFRSGHRTTDPIFVLNCLIQRALAQNSELYCCFLDLKKAFDSVSHALHFRKLLSLSMDSKLLRLIMNTYKKASSCVMINGALTEYFECNIGVRQGCPMSPILFSRYIHDLMQEVGNCGVCLQNYILPGLMFADDIVLISSNAAKLQLALNRLHSYFQRWKLTVNELKSKVLVFSNSVRRDLIFKYSDKPLELVESFKYLGLVISRNGSLTKAVDSLRGSALKVLHLLKARTKHSRITSPFVLCLLFEAIIEPVILYGSEIWGLKQYSEVERFLLNFAKKFYIFPTMLQT